MRGMNTMSTIDEDERRGAYLDMSHSNIKGRTTQQMSAQNSKVRRRREKTDRDTGDAESSTSSIWSKDWGVLCSGRHCQGFCTQYKHNDDCIPINLTGTNEFKIGSSKTSDLQIREDGISRRHCVIMISEVDGEKFPYLISYGKNGTFMTSFKSGQEAVSRTLETDDHPTRHPLYHGDKIEIQKAYPGKDVKPIYWRFFRQDYSNNSEDRRWAAWLHTSDVDGDLRRYINDLKRESNQLAGVTTVRDLTTLSKEVLTEIAERSKMKLVQKNKFIRAVGQYREPPPQPAGGADDMKRQEPPAVPTYTHGMYSTGDRVNIRKHDVQAFQGLTGYIMMFASQTEAVDKNGKVRVRLPNGQIEEVRACDTKLIECEGRHQLKAQMFSASPNIECACDVCDRVIPAGSTIYSCPRDCYHDVCNNCYQPPQAEGSDDDVCCVCIENKASVVFMPCKHQCVCIRCSDKLPRDPQGKQKCPKCRAAIEDKIIPFIG